MTFVPPEAFEYDDDVTPEAIEQLRVEADEILSKQEWTVVCMSIANGPLSRDIRAGSNYPAA